jgi:hypothetical protein
MSHPHPKQHPSRRPGHPISCVLQHPRRETTRRVHRPHASSTLTAHHHHRWQCFPSTSTSTSARAPSCWEVSRTTRCSSRQVRPVKLDGGFERSAHHPLAVVHVPAVLGVYAVSQRAQLRAAGRSVAMHQCSARLSWTVGVAAKLTPHTGMGMVTSNYSACWTPTTPTLASSPSVRRLATFHRAPSAVREWKLAVRVPPMNGCQHV